MVRTEVSLKLVPIVRPSLLPLLHVLIEPESFDVDLDVNPDDQVVGYLAGELAAGDGTAELKITLQFPAKLTLTRSGATEPKVTAPGATAQHVRFEVILVGVAGIGVAGIVIGQATVCVGLILQIVHVS